MTYAIEFNKALDFNLQLALLKERIWRKVNLIEKLQEALKASFWDCLRIFGHMPAEQEEMRQIYKDEQTLAKRAEQFITEEDKQEYWDIIYSR